MQTVIKATTAADFLALVPALSGYTPSRSIALVAFHGTRTLGVVRVDLPPLDADAHTISSTAATFIGLVCRLPNADGIAPVVYCDEPLYAESSPHPAYAALIDAVMRCADACGLRVRDALCVAADAWCSYLEAGNIAHPLAELDASAAHAALPAGLGPLLGDQHSGVELPAIGAVERQHVGAAIERLDHALESLDAAEDAYDSEWLDETSVTLERASRGVTLPGDSALLGTAGALGALCDLPALFEGALDVAPDSLGADCIAALLLCLARPSMRDVALSQWSFDLETGEQLLEAQLAWEDGKQFPAHLAAHMVGEGPRPDVLRVDAALSLVRYLAAVAPVAFRSAPLTLAAWLSWALGRSSHASAYLVLVREIEPDYGLAQIVSAMVTNGHLPEWAFERPEPVRGLDA